MRNQPQWFLNVDGGKDGVTGKHGVIEAAMKMSPVPFI